MPCIFPLRGDLKNLFPGLASNHNLLGLNLPSSQDDRFESLAPALKKFLLKFLLRSLQILMKFYENNIARFQFLSPSADTLRKNSIMSHQEAWKETARLTQTPQLSLYSFLFGYSVLHNSITCCAGSDEHPPVSYRTVSNHNNPSRCSEP
jgi:hypothetical protein